MENIEVIFHKLDIESQRHKPSVASGKLKFALVIMQIILTIATAISWNANKASALILAIPMFLWYFLNDFRMSRVQMECILQLCTFNTVTSVGYLLEALYWPEPIVVEASSKALVQIIPKLNASDINDL